MEQTDFQPPGRGGAPGELALVLAFINTVELDSDSDTLGTPDGACDWLASAGLLSPAAVLDEQGVRRLVEAREALRALAIANHGAPVEEDAIETLNRLAAESPLLVGFETDGSAWLEPACPGADSVVSRLLGIVFASMAEGTWERLKACREDTCKWAFYDHSKNRSGQWCSMRVCGNRVKTRAYRRRRREAPP